MDTEADETRRQLHDEMLLLAVEGNGLMHRIVEIKEQLAEKKALLRELDEGE